VLKYQLLTDDSHNNIDVRTLDLGQERKHFFHNDHFVKTVQQAIQTLESILFRLWRHTHENYRWTEWINGRIRAYLNQMT